MRVSPGGGLQTGTAARRAAHPAEPRYVPAPVPEARALFFAAPPRVRRRPRLLPV